MPRRGGVPQTRRTPRSYIQFKVVTKLINQVMYDGKKGLRSVLYTTHLT